MELNWLREERDGVVLTVKAVPRARANGVAGIEGDWLRVHLQAPPVDGKANEALIRWLAGTLGVPKNAVELLAGATARVKRVRIRGCSAAHVRAVLQPRQS